MNLDNNYAKKPAKPVNKFDNPLNLYSSFVLFVVYQDSNSRKFYSKECDATSKQLAYKRLQKITLDKEAGLLRLLNYVQKKNSNITSASVYGTYENEKEFFKLVDGEWQMLIDPWLTTPRIVEAHEYALHGDTAILKGIPSRPSNPKS